jgi:hypothetical protein
MKEASNTDKHEPKDVNPYVLNDDPNLTHDLSDKAEPKCTKSNTLKLEPK